MPLNETDASGVETVLQPHQPIPGQNASTDDSIVFDDELFTSLKGIEQLVARLDTLCDQLRAAHAQMDMQVNRIHAKLEEMWKENNKFRKRGLKGGRARAQQAKKGRLAVCMKDLTLDDHKHRREIERKDFKGRSQIEGLKQIMTIFEESHEFIRGQQRIAEKVVMSGLKMNAGVATTQESWILIMADELLPDAARNKEIDDIEAMLDAFVDEYGL
ncbi:hypothetical protein EDD37DRAFT_498417 [Exophiala viscosa]|uniref:uncharacterized protein n=1 Tax=Exophiala viscosa TaxID=2486360 RepID=UPI00218F368A|nr:hypothetical protein EDD37DRAFT_498417 [Exophiala viscosa]